MRAKPYSYVDIFTPVYFEQTFCSFYHMWQSAKSLANYISCVQTSGGLIHTAGHLPFRPDGSMITGILGSDLQTEEGVQAARSCALGIVSTIKGVLEARVVWLSRHGPILIINCDIQFAQQALIFNQSTFLGEVGDLDQVKRIVKLNVMVQSSSNFTDHPEVPRAFSYADANSHRNI